MHPPANRGILPSMGEKGARTSKPRKPARRLRSPVEGTWFAVPLDTGGYGVGVVARTARKGPFLGYFFGPRRAAVPTIEAVASLRAEDAVFVARVGDLLLIRGMWPVIRADPSWRREPWPMPVFLREDLLVENRVFIVEYAEDDPGVEVRERSLVGSAPVGAIRDGSFGAGLAATRLTEAIAAREVKR